MIHTGDTHLPDLKIRLFYVYCNLAIVEVCFCTFVPLDELLVEIAV